MAVYYYLAPYQLMHHAGEGRFSLDGSGRETRAARVMLYGAWDQARGTRCTAVKGGGANGWPKAWCLCRVQDDNPAAGLVDYTALNADAACIRLPIGPDVLERQFGSFSQTVQDEIVTRLENYRLPADLITTTTTVRQIIGFIVRLLFCAQQLGIDFPELDLTATWSTIPSTQRTRILAWATAHQVSTTGLSGSSTIRTILKRLVAANFGRIDFGGDLF